MGLTPSELLHIGRMRRRIRFEVMDRRQMDVQGVATLEVRGTVRGHPGAPPDNLQAENCKKLSMNEAAGTSGESGVDSQRRQKQICSTVRREGEDVTID